MTEPDIEIGAVVKAKRLRFNKKPQADVEVHGDPGVEGGSGSAQPVRAVSCHRSGRHGRPAAAVFQSERPPCRNMGVTPRGSLTHSVTRAACPHAP